MNNAQLLRDSDPIILLETPRSLSKCMLNMINAGLYPVGGQSIIKMRARNHQSLLYQTQIRLLLETFPVLENVSHIPNDLDDCLLVFARLTRQMRSKVFLN